MFRMMWKGLSKGAHPEHSSLLGPLDVNQPLVLPYLQEHTVLKIGVLSTRKVISCWRHSTANAWKPCTQYDLLKYNAMSAHLPFTALNVFACSDHPFLERSQAYLRKAEVVRQ